MYTQNNNKNIYQANNIVSDDEYINKHVACIVVGNKEFYEKYQQTAKKQNKDLDQLVGTDFLFGKYLNFETNEEEWLAQLKDLKRKLSIDNPKFANLKEIKFVLDEHGVEGNNRFLSANTQYYKSKRFQQVAQIINANFLNKNKDNKLYFSNRACYGTYNFHECNKKHDSDTHNNDFYSNNLYNILLTTFGNNARKVYCSQLKPEIGINRTGSINPNSNPFRNAVSLAQSILIEPSAIPNFLVNKGKEDKKEDTDLIKQYWYEGMKNIDPKIIEAPYCKIYFPLTQYRDCVPNALCLKPNGPKEYRVDSKIFENYTGLQGKTAKNEFLGRQYPKANIYHNNTQAKNMMSDKAKEIINSYNQELTKRRKEQEAQAKKEYIKAQGEYRRNHISFEQANHYMAYPFQYGPYNMFS